MQCINAFSLQSFKKNFNKRIFLMTLKKMKNNLLFEILRPASKANGNVGGIEIVIRSK